MNIYLIITILFIHWICDFIFQTDKMAKGKSKNNYDLLSHTLVYSLGWIPFSIILFGGYGCIFVLITLICHTITDYFTSRLNSKLWENGKVHYFFVIVGFDQLLHYTQLFLTFKLLYELVK